MLRNITLVLFVTAHGVAFSQQDNTRLYRFEKNNLYGYLTPKGDTAIAARWRKVKSFEKGKAFVQETTGKWAIINLKGEYVVPPEYDNISEISKEGIVGVTRNGLAGYRHVDSGKMISDIQWERASPFYKGYARVGKSNLFGIINAEGTLVCPVEYDEIDDGPTDGMIQVTKDSKTGFLDSTRHLAIAPQWSYARRFNEGYAVVLLSPGNYGFIDKRGKVVIKLEPGTVPTDFKEGFASITNGEKIGFINAQGKKIIPLSWDQAYPFSAGRAAVKRNGKWGFINTTGKIVIPLVYDDVRISPLEAEGKRNNTWELLFSTRTEPTVEPPVPTPHPR